MSIAPVAWHRRHPTDGIRWLSFLAACLLWLPSVGAHEMRPSLLELTARADGLHDVAFHIGYASGRPMALDARLPDHCRARSAPTVEGRDPVRVERWVVDCGEAGLTGQIAVHGLATTGTDVIVRAPGGTVILRPSAPAAPLPGAAETDGPGAAAAYVGIGVHHILFGPDHLLFVLGLVLLVGRRWRLLLGTVTAFTAAHSVTLALATLDVVRLPGRAVEAIIAASIVILAAELARGEGDSWARRAPWIFALTCGLLHGFGFAGVLADVGLPTGAVPWALLGFNAGVELGQLAFVGGVIGLGEMVRRWVPTKAPNLKTACIYGIGAVGAFWLWDRALPILQDWGI